VVIERPKKEISTAGLSLFKHSVEISNLLYRNYIILKKRDVRFVSTDIGGRTVSGCIARPSCDAHSFGSDSFETEVSKILCCFAGQVRVFERILLCPPVVLIPPSVEHNYVALFYLDSVDTLVCAGDIVGYGPSPKRCLELVRDREPRTVEGNHDRAVARGRPYESGDTYARTHLADESIQWLAGLP